MADLKREVERKDLIEKIRALAKELGRKPKKREAPEIYNQTRKLCGSWNNAIKAAGYETVTYQKIDLIKQNEDFAYFLGLLITDGTVYHNQKLKQYKVAIYTSYPEERDMLIELIKDLFSYTAHMSQRKAGFNKKINTEIRISSKKLVTFLVTEIRIPSGQKSLNCCIPEKIKTADEKIKKAFVRGVIDGDGSISGGMIKIASGSEQFLTDLKKTLNDLLIYSGKITAEGKQCKTFSIRICRKENIQKIREWYDTGYCYKRKRESINNL